MTSARATGQRRQWASTVRHGRIQAGTVRQKWGAGHGENPLTFAPVVLGLGRRRQRCLCLGRRLGRPSRPSRRWWGIYIISAFAAAAWSPSRLQLHRSPSFTRASS